jgi:3-dehydroquinate dehydratase
MTRPTLQPAYLSLHALRGGTAEWRIAVVNGPNLTSELARIDDFGALVTEWSRELGVTTEYFGSNHEGKLLEFIHASAESTDGYLVNPGGLRRGGEALRHALRDTKRPHVEVYLTNEVRDDRGSVFAPSVTAIFGGLRQFTYLGALVALTLALDDADFLGPTGDSAINRAHGAPRSLYG